MLDITTTQAPVGKSNGTCIRCAISAKPVFGGGQTMNNKIVKYEIQLAVPSNLVSQHLKKFTNLLQTTINKAQPMKNTEFISVKIIK